MIYPIFFIHSLADSYMGGFHILAIMNSAAMNIGMQIYLFQIQILMNYFGNIPRSGVVWSFDSSMFNFFWGLCILLSIAAAIFYIPSTGTIVHCWLKFDLQKGAMLNLVFSLSTQFVSKSSHFYLAIFHQLHHFISRPKCQHLMP